MMTRSLPARNPLVHPCYCLLKSPTVLSRLVRASICPSGFEHWIAFCAGTVILLALDMFVFHRDSHEPTLRESAMWTLFWCSLAVLFNLWLWWWAEKVQPPGAPHALSFLTGYLVEWSLSMDNVFVFVVIFSFFGVPLKYQYRVLFWGIFGAIAHAADVHPGGEPVARSTSNGCFYCLACSWSIRASSWRRAHGSETHPGPEHCAAHCAASGLRVAPGSHGDQFFVRHDGKLMVTSLFLVLLVIESTDVVFAIDSVPAIFGITKDPFIVFTSNMFAIMGLRALYFLLAGVMDLFRYLSYGLSAILIFIGVKMIVNYLLAGIPSIGSRCW